MKEDKYVVEMRKNRRAIGAKYGNVENLCKYLMRVEARMERMGYKFYDLPETYIPRFDGPRKPEKQTKSS